MMITVTGWWVDGAGTGRAKLIEINNRFQGHFRINLLVRRRHGVNPRSHAMRGNALSDALRPFWALIIISAICRYYLPFGLGSNLAHS